MSEKLTKEFTKSLDEKLTEALSPLRDELKEMPTKKELKESITSWEKGITKAISTSCWDDAPVDPVKGYRLDWAEQRERDRKQQEMRDFNRRRLLGKLSPYEKDYSVRKFVPGQGWAREWNRTEYPTIVHVPGVGYKKVYKRG